jgi:hypothetical protein
VPAVRRLARIVEIFGGALLADGVGLGKTYMALALATRYRRPCAVVPACLVAQWQRTSDHLGIPLVLRSHESLSHAATLPRSDYIVVDEAHRFRNPRTRRYDRLARDIRRARVLLVTATPVVNHARDLVHALRLFLPDGGLAFLGIPSLERGAEANDVTPLACAVDRLSVARPAGLLAPLGCSLPTVREGGVVRAAPVHTSQLDRLVAAATDLRFPGVPTATAHLLRTHLLHRLASSLSAFRGTVTRHLAYVDRALSSGGKQRPTRRALRHLLGPGDDLQFELWGTLDATPEAPCSTGDLVRERGRLLRILESVDVRAPSPKAVCLERFLDGRRGKTLVFTSSAETAQELGRRLAWQRLGIVAAGKGRIATGSLGVERVLDLFAPRARGVTRPDTRRTPLDILIATDLVSEGLDLQDADAVVHYDLPWTPVRLAQRLGRTVRLGSTRPQVHVTWFAPPVCLERHLQIERRLSRKAHAQLALTVPVTSSVGRAQVFNYTMAAREALCLDSVSHPHSTEQSTDTACAVVRGPMVLMAALRWHLHERQIDELVALEGHPPHPLTNQADVLRRFIRLREGCAVETGIPAALRRALLALLRARLRTCHTGSPGPAARHLRRRVLRAGVRAGKGRHRDRLALLDEVLERVHGGCSVGAERALALVLEAGASDAALATWLSETPHHRNEIPDVQIVAVLSGDGSVVP